MVVESFRVLVCEDDPAMLRIFQFLLRKQGITTVLTTSDGAKVVSISQREKPHLILLDLMLPGKDGLSVLKDLKNSEITSGIPVIVISGIESKNQVSLAIDAGAADYVTKPFDSMELGTRLQEFLQALYNTPSTHTGPASGPGMTSGGPA
jgi:DNA-binding response OmpR family regulator